MTDLPTDYTNSTPARDLHADAHNDVNAAVNDLREIAAEALPVFKVANYGAVGDGITDDGPAIQEAMDAAAVGGGIVWFEPGATYQIVGTSLILRNGIQLQGTSTRAFQGSTIRSGTVDLFTITGTTRSVNISGLYLRSTTGGGHIINVGASYSLGRVRVTDCELRQDNNAKSVWASGLEMLECRFQDIVVQHTATATVPTFHIVSTNNAASLNVFDGIRFLFSGNYGIHIENTAGSGYSQDNVIRNINFEVCHGGQIRILSCRNTIIENCHDYDATAHTKSRIYLGKSTTGIASFNNAVVQCGRRGAPTMTGVYDIECQTSGAARTEISGCNGLINLNSTSAVIINPDSSSPAATFSNLHAVTTIIEAGGQVKVGSFATGSRPSATTFGAGTQVYDSTLDIPIWSDGTVWRDAAGTAV